MVFPTGTLTTALTVATSGTVMYVSADGKDRGLGSITNEDIVAVGQDFKFYKIEVVGDIVYVTITGPFENGTVMRPWTTISLNADAAGAVVLAANSTSDYSYFVSNAGLSTALESNVASLVVIGIVA